MTLCIAALCSEDGDNAATHVVVSSDSRIENDFVGAELHYKLLRLTDDWSVLVSGDEDEYYELISEYVATLQTERQNITHATAFEILTKPPNTIRKRRADTLTQRRLAMSYDAFIQHGKEQLPRELQKQILDEVLRQELAADLILIGSIDSEVAVFRYDGDDHRVTRVYDFAAIGSGNTIAEGSVFQRSHDQFESIQRTLYLVYEAQRNGQAAPGVGEDMAMAVIDSNGNWNRLSIAAIDRLAYLYENHFGPRDLDSSNEEAKAYMKSPPGPDFFEA